jgi:hypothetical protein
METEVGDGMLEVPMPEGAFSENEEDGVILPEFWWNPKPKSLAKAAEHVVAIIEIVPVGGIWLRSLANKLPTRLFSGRVMGRVNKYMGAGFPGNRIVVVGNPVLLTNEHYAALGRKNDVLVHHARPTYSREQIEDELRQYYTSRFTPFRLSTIEVHNPYTYVPAPPAMSDEEFREYVALQGRSRREVEKTLEVRRPIPTHNPNEYSWDTSDPRATPEEVRALIDAIRERK